MPALTISQRHDRTPHARRHRLLTGESRPWLVLFATARVVASALAIGLVVWDGIEPVDAPLLIYGPVSTAVLLLAPGARRAPLAWAVDFAAALALVIASGDWRSPYYPLWLTTLALPAVSLSLRHAAVLALSAPVVFVVVALLGGPSPGELNLVSSETLAIHLLLPVVLVGGLAYAKEVLRQLQVERARGERLAIERERRRIAWELHDSAKQRVHAAHLLVSSLRDRVDAEAAPAVARAAIELESAAAEMDTSLAELRSPLEGRPLEEALRTRASELATASGPWISVRGRAPRLSPLAEAHAYRIGCEALTNALRHADARMIEVTVETAPAAMRLLVRDDGRGMPEMRRSDASGLCSMESRAASIGATLTIGAGVHGAGTVVSLEVPIEEA